MRASQYGRDRIPVYIHFLIHFDQQGADNGSEIRSGPDGMDDRTGLDGLVDFRIRQAVIVGIRDENRVQLALVDALHRGGQRLAFFEIGGE